MLHSYAQNAEDVVLWRALRDVGQGTYVDVGAADPELDSVTKLFYDAGWSGLNVEPVAELAAALRESRPRDITVDVAAGRSYGEATLHVVPGTGLSSLRDFAAGEFEHDGFEVTESKVEVRTLNELLEGAGFRDREIHFLKIDVEGAERDVLGGLDLEVWRPWILAIEATEPRSATPAFHAWEPLVLEMAYVFTLFDGLNRFYVASEHAELVPAMSYPACVFDQPYVTRPHREALEESQRVLAGYRSLQRELENTTRAYGNLEQEWKSTVDGYQKLEQEWKSTVESYQRLERESFRAQQRYQTLEEQHAVLVEAHQEVSATTAAIDRELRYERDLRASLEGAIGSMQDQIDVLRHGIQMMNVELDTYRSALEAERAQLALVLGSLSWRVTAPLRAVRARLSGGRTD